MTQRNDPTERLVGTLPFYLGSAVLAIQNAIFPRIDQYTSIKFLEKAIYYIKKEITRRKVLQNKMEREAKK